MSKAEIVNLIVNLQDAHKNLNADKFNSVYSLFKLIERNKEKLCFNSVEQYYEIAKQIIYYFDEIAPFEYYSGMDSIDSYVLMSQIREENNEIDSSTIAIKVNGLVYGVKGSIGDVFYNLCGSDAAVFSIISISSALKNYLDEKSTNNPIFEEISKSFVCEIAKTCANNNEAINEMIKNISSLSQSFEDRIAIAKNNFEECNEIELYGIAAASLYCNFQKKTINIDDESKIEMYFEIFKTVFVKLVETL